MRLQSWPELQGFWNSLKTGYSKRELKPSNIVVRSAGDSAWAVLDWEFNGTQADGKPVQTKGWETQVYGKTDRGWRLRHVHFSSVAGPPPQ